MKSYIFSSLCAVVICVMYIAWKYNLLKEGKWEKFHPFLKDMVDVSPIIIFSGYFSPLSAFFLLGCVIANELIYDYTVLGGIVFMVVYGISSIMISISYAFSWVKLFFSLLPIALIAWVLCSKWKVTILLKILGCLYALCSFVPCVYASLISGNVGFILLVVGDILLIVNEIKANKMVKTISDCIYFMGTCMVPMALISLG